MHRLLLPPTLLCVVASSALPLWCAEPWTSERVLARHIQALGGAAALKAHHSRRSVSTLQGLAPFDIPVVVEQTRERYRRDVTIQSATQTTAFDGTTGWKVDPFAGADTPQTLSGVELQDLLEQMDFDGDLVDAAAKGHTLRYEGLEALSAGPAHKLQLRLKNGRTSTVYLDATTFLEVKRVQTRLQMGQPATVEVAFSDYRDVQGVKLPFAVAITPQGAPQGLHVRTDKVEVNITLPEARFRRPGA